MAVLQLSAEKNINFKELEVTWEEGVAILIDFNNINLCIYAVYRPPKFENKQLIILEDLHKLYEKHCTMIIGDINTHADWKNNTMKKSFPFGDQLMDLMQIFNLKQIVLEDTYYEQNYSSILDVIIVPEYITNCSVAIGPPFGKSDHATVTTHICIHLDRATEEKNKNITFKNWEKANWIGFEQFLGNIANKISCGNQIEIKLL